MKKSPEDYPLQNPDTSNKFFDIIHTINIVSTAWMSEAVCRDQSPELFFPHGARGVRTAKAICETCIVREECLEYAISNNIQTGIWGGTSERERRILQKERRAT